MRLFCWKTCGYAKIPPNNFIFKELFRTLKESDNMENLKWYVLNYDFNGKKVESFNIFRSCRCVDDVKELLDNYITFDDFVEKLEKQLQ